jgi:uncharacterized protein (TIGR03118 family)
MKTAALAFSIIAGSLLATSALASPHPLSDTQLGQVVAGTDFTIVNEVSDQAIVGAPTTDPLLVNSWGLSMGPGTFLWVADNGTGVSTLYDPSSFAKAPLNVTIPGPGGVTSAPTGTVFTSFTGNSFRVTEAGKTGHSLFLFDSEDGLITGWAPTVDFTNAVVAVDHSAQGDVFKGLTLLNNGAAPFLYAADFAHNRVEVFNNQFSQIATFTDPSLPAGYSPFNVQALNGLVYVAFAKHGEGHDEAHGAGLGFVDVFNTQGHKIATLIANGVLNAPWGLTIAPASFGQFAGDLLVGNFGDGKINAFNPTTGAFVGTMDNAAGTALFIDGLWALRNGPDGVVVFSSGPDGENHGLVGVIKPDWAAASWAFQSHVILKSH